MEQRVFIHKNEFGAERKILVYNTSDSMAKFLKAAGKKLGTRAKKVYLVSGVEVESVREIQADDELYVSAGEPFFKDTEGTGGGVERLNISVLGTGGVGKSAITLRFVRRFFVPKWDPTIEDAYRKTIDVDERPCLLEIVDTAGQDDFDALRPQWMAEKDGYLFVFSMDSSHSLAQLEPFFELHQQINENAHVPIVLVANKKDLVDKDPSCRQVTAEAGRRVAERYGATYMETSALTGEGVIECFETFVREVRKLREGSQEVSKPAGRRFWCTLL